MLVTAHIIPLRVIPLRLGDGQRVVKPFSLLRLLADVIGVVSGERVAVAGCVRGEVPACADERASEDGVDHWDVADDDGDEGFAAGPAAGFLGAVFAGLVDMLVVEVGMKGIAYCDDEDAAEDPGHHDKETAAEEDEELKLFTPW